MIGITPDILPPTIPVGSPKRQSTTLARRVGVFPMVETMVYGQRLCVHPHIFITLMTAVEKV